MAIAIEIKPEDIDNLIKDSLIKAGLGARITKAVSEVFGYNSPIDAAVKDYVSEVSRKLIREKFSEQIREAVSAMIEKRVTEDLIKTMVDEAGKRLEEAASDRY